MVLHHVSCKCESVMVLAYAAKGQYIKSCVVASTMGPGVKVNGAKLV